jgi:hypothetical protein
MIVIHVSVVLVLETAASTIEMAPTIVTTHLHVVCTKFSHDIRRLRLNKCRRVRGCGGRERDMRCSICKTDKEEKRQTGPIACHCISRNDTAIPGEQLLNPPRALRENTARLPSVRRSSHWQHYAPAYRREGEFSDSLRTPLCKIKTHQVAASLQTTILRPKLDSLRVVGSNFTLTRSYYGFEWVTTAITVKLGLQLDVWLHGESGWLHVVSQFKLRLSLLIIADALEEDARARCKSDLL